MNANPGRYLSALLLLAVLVLRAEDFTYAVHVPKHDPYLKEPLLLRVDINQTNPDVVLFFRFQINPSDAYRIKQIDASHDDTLHHASMHYRYLLYPLKTGEQKVSFTLVKRLTDEAKVAYSFSGDRDDFKKLETTDSVIPVTPVTLHVRPLPEGTRFVGDFTLQTFFPKQEAAAYEPLPMRVIIEGSGYPPVVSHLLPASFPVTHFDTKPVLTQHIVDDTVKYKAVYEMALSSDKSFTLPSVSFKAFNPKTSHTYLLRIPEHRFRITPVNVNTLVDTVDTPKPLQLSWEWLTDLLTYLMVFGAGFATAWLLKYKRRIQQSKVDPMYRKIETAPDKKHLLQLLIAHEPERFQETIAKLEADLYGQQHHTLKALKQEAKERLA